MRRVLSQYWVIEMFIRDNKSENHIKKFTKRISSNALNLNSPVTLRYNNFVPTISYTIFLCNLLCRKPMSRYFEWRGLIKTESCIPLDAGTCWTWRCFGQCSHQGWKQKLPCDYWNCFCSFTGRSVGNETCLS